MNIQAIEKIADAYDEERLRNDAAEIGLNGMARGVDRAQRNRDWGTVAKNVGYGTSALGAGAAVYNAGKLRGGWNAAKSMGVPFFSRFRKMGPGWKGLVLGALAAGAGYLLGRTGNAVEKSQSAALKERTRQLYDTRRAMQHARAGEMPGSNANPMKTQGASWSDYGGDYRRNSWGDYAPPVTGGMYGGGYGRPPRRPPSFW